MDYQKLLLQHLELVDRVVRYIARRHHLSATDTDEFASIVRFRLIDRDFAILRKFEGRSNLATYLTTVIERLYLDYCIVLWGKWRPSAAARRLGPEAELLEQLLGRDGLTFDEAVGTLQTNHGVTTTREELHVMMQQLPLRAVRRHAGEEELALVAARGGALDSGFARVDDQEIADRLEAALASAVRALLPQDQLVLKLRFQDGLAVSNIARLLHIDPKVLYRRLEQIVRTLHKHFQQQGIDRAQINRIVGHAALTLDGVLAAALPEDSDAEKRPRRKVVVGKRSGRSV